MSSSLAWATLGVLLLYLVAFAALGRLASRAAGRSVWLFGTARGPDFLAALAFRAAFVEETLRRLGLRPAADPDGDRRLVEMFWTFLEASGAPFEPRLTSNIDTTYFPTDEIDQTDNATMLKAQAIQSGRGTQPEESPEMSLPFIGYTFKRFDNNFR